MLCAAFVFTGSVGVFGASKYWVGNATGSATSPVSGTWNTTAGNWSASAAGNGGTTFTAGDAPVFGGADGTYAVTVGGNFNSGAFTFSNSGYTLSAASAQTITMTGAINIAAGKTATVGNNLTVTYGTANGQPTTINGGGTLIVNGTVASSSGSSSAFTVGNTVGDDVTLTIAGGAATVNRASSSLWIPVNGGSGNIKGTVNLNSGSITEIGGFVSIGMGSGTVGTLNLNGGTLTTAAITGAGSTGSTGAGTGIVNFNGGTLKAQQASASFVVANTAAYVRNGGALINNNNFAITIAQPLLHTTNVSDNAIDGGLASSGANTLTLTGANTYNGPTAVNAGKLVTTTASIGGGSYSVADGATLEVQVNTPGTSLTNSSLTLGSSAATTLNFTLGGNASANTPAIQDNGALVLNGLVTVNVTGSFNTSASTNLLVNFASISGAGSVAAGNSIPAATGGAVRTLAVQGNQLVLTYTAPAQAPQAMHWTVGDGNWDTTTLNWQPLGGGSAMAYVENSPVVFDDAATGTSPITVTISGVRSPGSITNDSTKNFILTGSGNISGAGALTKSGNGTLVVDINCSYGGGTFINSGTLQVGNNDNAGSLGTGNVANNGTLTFNRTDNLTVGNVIAGAGGITQNGSGALALASTNTYSGPTLANSGKLAVLATSAGAGDFTIADNAIFEVQAPSAASSLIVNSLTLGVSGNLTQNFALGASHAAGTALVADVGALNLNGTVTVNVTGSGMSSGTYVLMTYNSFSGSGSFVPGAMPAGVWTLVNDATAKQLKLVGLSGLVWDAGNTGNGAVIDAASGTWDLTAGNIVWNSAGANVPFGNGSAAIFDGADGSYGITVAADMNVASLTFSGSGYALTNDVAHTLTIPSATAMVVVNSNKTATIGTNVTVSGTATAAYSVNAAGGTLIIDGGGRLQTTQRGLNINGSGALVSVKAGGVISTPNAAPSPLNIGNLVGDSPTLSVDGGTISIQRSTASIWVPAVVAGNVQGALTLNSGTITTVGGFVSLGAGNGNTGTLNLNGGTLSAKGVTGGGDTGLTGSGTSIANFNGGTLKGIVNNDSFVGTLTAAYVCNGGLTIDNNGLSLGVNQLLLHSTNSSDGAVDGGLAVIGTGTVTLNAANAYTGPTTVSAGTLALGVANALPAATIVNLAGGTLNMSTYSATVVGLEFNGVAAAQGTWGSVGSAANHQTSQITGTGILTVSAGGSSIVSLNSDIGSSVYGQTVNFTATVTAVGGSGATPTGSVTFMNDATVLGTVALDGSGVATLAVDTLPAGTDSITAVYNGDNNYDMSTSIAIQEIVSQHNPGLMDGSGSYEVDMNNAVGAAGGNPGWNWINLDNNSLTITSTADQPFTIKLVSYSNNVPGLVSNFTCLSNYTWCIATSAVPVVGFTNSSQFIVNSDSFSNFLGGGAFSVTTNAAGNGLNLVFTRAQLSGADIAKGWCYITNDVDQSIQVEMWFSDPNGLAKVAGSNLLNCTLECWAVSNGTTNHIGLIGADLETALPEGTTNVQLIATRIDPAQDAVANAVVWDEQNNPASLAPIQASVNVTGGNGVRHEFDGVPSTDRFVRVANGNPGFTAVRILVNGQSFAVNGLAANRVVDVDVGSAMVEGSDNVIVLECYGALGAGAVIDISDVQGAVLANFVAGSVSPGDADPSISLPRITITQDGNDVVISWPVSESGTDYSGYELQGGDLSGSAWVSAGTPQLSGDHYSVRVSAVDGLKLFRLAK